MGTRDNGDPKNKYDQLKYNIQLKLDNLPKRDYAPALEELCQLLGIKRPMLYTIRNYKLGEKGAVNSDRLLVIANFFNCTVDELINRPTPSPAQATKKAS